jgi:hypothetical protein
MSGRSQKYRARVGPQHDAPDMIVPMMPPMSPVLVFVSIDRFQNRELLCQNPMIKRGNPNIMIIESVISVYVWNFP